MANVLIYKEEWKEKLQERLEEPKYFMDLAKVEYTDTKVMHNPYRDAATATATTRGNQYTVTDINTTDETVDINLYYSSVEFIDKADMAQTGYNDQMDMAERQADALMDVVETAFLAEYANAGTAIDNATLGGAAGPITLTSANVLEIIRKAREAIVAGKGLTQFNREGASIVWTPGQFEKLVAAAQNIGFSQADEALYNGRVGVYGGFKHFESNLNTSAAGSTYALAFVNKAIHVGILNTTFGDVTVVENPDRRSGWDVESRVDFQTKIWNQKAPLVVSIEVTDATS